MLVCRSVCAAYGACRHLNSAFFAPLSLSLAPLFSNSKFTRVAKLLMCVRLLMHTRATDRGEKFMSQFIQCAVGRHQKARAHTHTPEHMLISTTLIMLQYRLRMRMQRRYDDDDDDACCDYRKPALTCSQQLALCQMGKFIH